MATEESTGDTVDETFKEESRADGCYRWSNAGAQLATYDSAHAARWCENAGFLDPFEVVYTCVTKLKAATYPNVKYRHTMSNSPHQRQPDKSQLCPGLRLYFCKLEPDAKIDAEVAEYIKTGHSDILRRLRRTPNLVQVLMFLVKYLHLRGPLVKIRQPTQQNLAELRNTQRWVSRAFLNVLSQHELEFSSVVMLGDYLDYVITVAYAHDLHWMKEVLADLFGPLLVGFVGVGAGQAGIPKSQLPAKQSDLMLRIIQGTPWGSMKRQQNFHLVLSTHPDSEGYRRRSNFDFDAGRKLMQRPTRQPPMVTGCKDIVDFLEAGDARPEVEEKH